MLILKRSDAVSEFALAWDGVFGIGDAEDLAVVFNRVTEATGISSDSLKHIRGSRPRTRIR